jgi:hypothetical protein
MSGTRIEGFGDPLVALRRTHIDDQCARIVAQCLHSVCIDNHRAVGAGDKYCRLWGYITRLDRETGSYPCRPSPVEQ